MTVTVNVSFSMPLLADSFIETLNSSDPILSPDDVLCPNITFSVEDY